MIRKLFATLCLVAFAGGAFASSCPLLMNEIDEVLDDPTAMERLSEEQLIHAKQLRDEGEQYHQQGEHEKSVETLNEAREVLGLS